MTIQQLLELVISRNASDLHLSVGEKPLLRINGVLVEIPQEETLTEISIESLIFPLLSIFFQVSRQLR
jgi:Tfp pilus assembly pilus retraction ATPase PilT